MVVHPSWQIRTIQNPKWRPIGTGLYDPVAVAPKPGRIVLFARNGSGELVVLEGDGLAWSEGRSLGMPIAQHPGGQAPVDWPLAACSSAPNRIDLFARSPDGELLHSIGEGWSDFESLWMPLTRDAEPQRLPFLGAVTACTWGEDRLDVFARALDGHLYHARWDGGWDRG